MVLAWEPWPVGLGPEALEALAWGPWLKGPRRGGVWTYGRTKYPLYSTGHRPPVAAAQKGKIRKKEKNITESKKRSFILFLLGNQLKGK